MELQRRAAETIHEHKRQTYMDNQPEGRQIGVTDSLQKEEGNGSRDRNNRRRPTSNRLQQYPASISP